MTRVAVLTGHDVAAWRRDHVAGRVPAALPYQVDALAEDGFELAVCANPAGPVATRLRAKVEHRTGYGVVMPLRAAPAVARGDLMLALLEREGALAARLRRHRIPPYSHTPLVIWSCWLADDVARADRDRRKVLLDRFRGADLITHLSRHETGILVDLGLPEDRLMPITYGVSDAYYVADPAVDRDIEVLAVGQDRGRDYATLFEAVRGTDLLVELVCRSENLRGLDPPANVRVRPPVPLPEYRRLLQRARVVVVPTHERAYPTGSSVALEASSTSCCVVATGTRALADYIRDGVSGRLVPESDADAWRSVLLELRDDPGQRRRLAAAARRSVEERFNARRMWHDLAGEVRRRGLV